MTARELTFQDQSVAVVDQAIDDEVGDGSIAEIGMPLVDARRWSKPFLDAITGPTGVVGATVLSQATMVLAGIMLRWLLVI